MQLPEPDPTRLKKRPELIRRLLEILPQSQVIHRPEDLVVYECDGLSAYRQRPMAVVLAASTEQVSQVLRLCHSLGIPIVPGVPARVYRVVPCLCRMGWC